MRSSGIDLSVGQPPTTTSLASVLLLFCVVVDTDKTGTVVGPSPLSWRPEAKHKLRQVNGSRSQTNKVKAKRVRIFSISSWPQVSR